MVLFGVFCLFTCRGPLRHTDCQHEALKGRFCLFSALLFLYRLLYHRGYGGSVKEANASRDDNLAVWVFESIKKHNYDLKSAGEERQPTSKSFCPSYSTNTKQFSYSSQDLRQKLTRQCCPLTPCHFKFVMAVQHSNPVTFMYSVSE